MPYSKEHKKQSRQKILNSAVALFSSRGFDQVSINDLMEHAGLTRGAFYAHFDSKQAVYAKAIITGAKNSRFMSEKPDGASQKDWIRNLLFGYLSQEHINQELPPCPLAFLVTDIANNETEVQETYARMFRRLNKGIELQLKEYAKEKESTSPSKEDVLAATAMMIGGVAIGRVLNNDVQTKKLLDSCRQGALDLLKTEF